MLNMTSNAVKTARSRIYKCLRDIILKHDLQLSFRTLPKQFLGIFCGLGISRGSRCWELAAA